MEEQFSWIKFLNFRAWHPLCCSKPLSASFLFLVGFIRVFWVSDLGPTTCTYVTCDHCEPQLLLCVIHEVTCQAVTSPKAKAFSLLHGSNKVLCTHRPEGDCHWFLGKAFFSRISPWRKLAVCATDARSAFGGLTEWWIGSSICLHVEGLL